MIREIEITNWKTHKNTHLYFQKGVNVLIGIMGAGKSSVMDAISFGLFGTFPALNSKRIALSGLMTNRPAQQDFAEVRITFDVGGNQYSVHRKIGDGAGATLEKNGAYLQAQPTKVTEEVTSLLKLDYETFARAIYAEQNRLDYFLELPKGERKKQIDNMLGLDAFAVAEENATALINRIKEGIKSGEELLSKIDLKAFEKKRAAFAEEEAVIKQAQEKIIKEEVLLQKEISSNEKRLVEIRKIAEARSVMEKGVAEAKSRMATLENEIKKMKELSDMRSIEKRHAETTAVLEKVEKELSGLRKAERDATKRFSGAEAKLEEYAKLAAQKKKLFGSMGGLTEETAKKKLDSENAELDKLSAHVAGLQGKKGETVKWLAELQKHISKCPVCERELEELARKKLLERREAEILSMGEEIEDGSKSLAAKTKLVKELREIHNGISVAQKQLESMASLEKDIEKEEKERNAAEKELKSATAEIKGLETRGKELSEQLNALKTDMQNAQRRERYTNEVKACAAELERSAEKLMALKVDDKQMYALQDIQNKLSAELGAKSAEIKSNGEMLAKIAEQKKGVEEELLRFGNMEKGIETKRATAAELNKFKSALIETEVELRAMIVGAINSLMLGLWTQLYPYGDYTALRLDAKSDDYQLVFGAGESWLPVDAVASGGERSIACLTMRIALAMVIVPNLKWLILDEPTHNLDAAGISKFVEVLGASLPGVVEQIFIITHDESLRQIESAKVYLFGRDKGRNGATVVSET